MKWVWAEYEKESIKLGKPSVTYSIRGIFFRTQSTITNLQIGVQKQLFVFRVLDYFH